MGKDSVVLNQMSWNAAAIQEARSSSWDDEVKPTQPLCNLYHYNMISSPSHEDEEEGKAPVVGEILDFDEHVTSEMPDGAKAEIHEVSIKSCSLGGENGPKRVSVIEPTVQEDLKEDEQEDDDEGSIAESILNIAMFEGVLPEDTEEEGEEEDIVPLPVIHINVPTYHSKRCAELDGEDRPIKKAKELPPPPPRHLCEAPPKPKTPPKAPAPTVATAANVVEGEEGKKMPAQPRRRRPGCLFINHFGTRLNDKGKAVRVNTPAKHLAPHRISSEESVSIKTKSTGRSSKTSSTFDSKRTPVKSSLPDSLISPVSSVPTVVQVRIVTPNKKKPINSSCLEEITMEEDELEPIKHDVPVVDCDEPLKERQLPYIHSISDSAPPTPTPARRAMAHPCASPSSNPAMAHMMAAGMMPSGMPLNFNRPFPLLQRRAFLSGCHPMVAPHMASFGPGWGQHPAAAFPGPGVPFNPQLAAFAAAQQQQHQPHLLPPPSASSPMPSQAKSQQKKP